MKKQDWCLKHLPNELPPPHHTKVRARCFTCKKFPVCNIRTDYLKTLKLMEDVLGSPCDNFELIHLPGFTGKPYLYGNVVMPDKVLLTFKDKEKQGEYFALKFQDVDNYSFVYDMEGYKIIFDAKYNNGETSFAEDFSEEELFNCFDLDGFTYPPRVDHISGWDYHYKPVGFNFSKTDLDLLRDTLDSIETGKFNARLSFTVNVIFGNYNNEDRYPTEEEIVADPDAIIKGHTVGIILLPLEKVNGVIQLQEGQKATIIISPYTDTANWDNTFKAQKMNFSEETTQNIFNLLNKQVEEGNFEISVGKDAFYGFEVNLSQEDKTKINEALIYIRNKLLEEEEKDIINTTAFRVMLECHFYEWEKGLTEKEGLERILLKFPNGIPLGDEELFHIQTQHIEPKKVCCYHPQPPTFMPMPLPPKCKKRPPTRDELNEF